MPIYEYECESCGQVSEFRQKFSDPPITECEQCKGPLQKLISQSSFHLKGGGWYSGGYGKKPKASESGDKGKKSGASPEKKEKTAATKPEKKADSKKKG